jgi:hypothetical protein
VVVAVVGTDRLRLLEHLTRWEQVVLTVVLGEHDVVAEEDTGLAGVTIEHLDRVEHLPEIPAMSRASGEPREPHAEMRAAEPVAFGVGPRRW